MIEGFLALSLSVITQAGFVTVDKDSVTAQGVQDVVVKVQKPGMVHVGVNSDVGVTCTLIDHQRGPFWNNGQLGKTSCKADLLLDQGLYKLRLTSPGEKPGKAKKKSSAVIPTAGLDVKGFVDVDAPLVLLPGTSSTVRLPEQKQVTRWLRIPQQQEIVVDVYGRTAGRVSLWRDGQWIEEATAKDTVERPQAGRPIHHQRLITVVDPGDYTLVVYGADAQTFSAGSDDDTAFIAFDAPPASTSRSEVFTLPAWGVFSVKAPGGLAAFLSIDGARSEAVSMTAESVVEDKKLGAMRGAKTACSIDPASPVGACTLTSGGSSDLATVLTVQGPPGTRGRIIWAPNRSTTNSIVGDARSDLSLDVGKDTTSIAVSGLPMSIDAAPLGCALDRLSDRGAFEATVARDLVSVGLTQAWKRKFNTDATTTAVWLNIEKPGLYGISGNDALGASCEVYRLDVTGTDKVRVGEGKDGVCNQKIPLPAGPIEVRFYGGKPGIQELRVGQVGLAALVGNDNQAPMKSGCVFADLKVNSGRYRVRTSGPAGASLRAVFATGSGLPASDGAIVVSVDPGRPVAIKLAPGVSVQAKNVGPGAFSCAFADAALPSCETGPLTAALTSSTLTLTNSGARPTLAIIGRVTPPVPPPSLDPYNGAVPRLPVVQAGSTAWFNLDGTKSKSFLVDVATAGLFDVETEGLLATRCQVRTAVTANLFSGEMNGRGRNCLVESYLKPGRYLVTVDAKGSSVGRAGLTLKARPAWAGGDLTLGDERFVTVEPGTLARHGFTLKKSTEVAWGVQAQSGGLSCRLDDDDGWPVRTVPHDCAGNEVLEAGRYTVTVLPMTVESRRSLRLGEPVLRDTLRGDKTHALALNTNYDAELGEDGKDNFAFSVGADIDVAVRLGTAMQGRIYAADAKGKKGEVVAGIAPTGGTAFGLVSNDGGDGGDGSDGGDGNEGGDGEYNEGNEGEYNGDGEYSDGGDGNEGGNGEYGDGGDGGDSSPRDDGRAAASMLSATVHQPLPALGGEVVSLKAGSYILETEHTRGDVGVGYGVGIFVRALLPGTSVSTRAPAVVDVIGPSSSVSGLVRIKTRGQTDVACRLLDGNGTLVAASSGSGADWNCALAVPLMAGNVYRLYVDAEVLEPGPTEIKAEFLEAKDTGALKDGDSWKLVGKVARANFVAAKGKVTDINLTAAEDFSCAAFDTDGRLLDRHVGVRRCSLLLWGNDSDAPFSVMAWTADRPASVKVGMRERSLKGLGGIFGGTSLDDDVVATANLPGRGRFETAPNARCLPKNQRGALTPCPVAASFDPGTDGDTILVGVALGEKASVPFAERIASLDKRQSDERQLGPRHGVEHQKTPAKALHLVDVRSLPGSGARPACTIEGGASSVDESRCVAASGLTTDSVLAMWTRPGGSLPVRLVQQSIVPPTATPLVVGTSTVTGAVRSTLPTEPWRLDLAVPKDTWVVQLDDADRAVDLCAPDASLKPLARVGLARCVLRGRGGSVVVARAIGDANGKDPFEVRADVIRFAAFDEPARLLQNLFELKARGPGRERLRFAAGASDRSLRVEGPGVKACAIHTDDGGRIAGCAGTIGKGLAGDVVIEHDGRAIRASLGNKGDFYGNRFGALPSSSSSSSGSAAMQPGRAEGLSGNLVQRTLTAPVRGVLRVRATGGVCAVTNSKGTVVGSEGVGAGCDLGVVVDKGDARIWVRGFGGGSLAGTLAVGFEPITTLTEGVGKETVVQPGEARVFEVTLESDGELGVGLKVDAEVLECALLNSAQEVVADGCQIFGRFNKGTWWLRVEAPPDSGPRRFSPVVFGLKGADIDVPEDYLREFFRRVPRPVTPVVDASKEVR